MNQPAIEYRQTQHGFVADCGGCKAFAFEPVIAITRAAKKWEMKNQSQKCINPWTGEESICNRKDDPCCMCPMGYH